MQIFKKSMSILLSLIMVFSLFTIIPVTTAGAEGGDVSAPGIHEGITPEKGNISLSWSTPTDSIHTNKYSSGGTVTLQKPFNNGTMILPAGTVSDLNTINSKTLTPPHFHDGVTFEAWTAIDSLPTSGSWYLTANVTVSSLTTILDDSTLNLCLNGKTVTYTGSNGSVFQVGYGSRGTLNLYDEDGDHGVITGGKGFQNSGRTFGGNVRITKGTFNMYGGTISGGTAQYGGGVYIQTGSAFNMYGGSITGCSATEHGGGVYVNDDASFTMYGGTISGNNTDTSGDKYGGGVMNYGTFTLNSGLITNNTSVYGGGVCIKAYIPAPIFNLNGGTITNNTAIEQGGGIYTYLNTDGKFNISGGTVSGNTANGLGDNTVLRDNHTIHITGALGDNVYDVALTDANNQLTNGVFTSGLSGNGDVSNFTNGNGAVYRLRLNADGEAELVKTYTVTWKNYDDSVIGKSTVEAGATPEFSDEIGEIKAKPEDDNYTYTFSGWSDGSNTYAADALPAVSGDVTYTAQYTATAKTFKAYAKKLTGETYTIENLTGETTVAQLKEIIADQIDIPATAQRLIFAGKQLEDAKTLAEYNIVEESTIHLVIRGYTVTWLNYDNSELGTTTVQYGATPSYDGETPTKAEDENYTYTFAGWSPEITAVTGDVTYTATFDATPKAVPAKLTINVGENGKVVMDNGTFGNATDASNIVDITAPFNITDGSNVFIVDDHTANLVEGGSINIATGGELSFYPSADNTGVITAIPDEGYFCTGWYDGDTLYSSGAALAYQNISEDITLTAKFAPEQDIFTKHSITLNGTVDENFFIDPVGAGYTVDEIASGAKTISVSFDWDESFSVYSDLSAFDVTINKDNFNDYLQTSGAMAGQFMVTCKVAAAEMTCDVKATATVSDGTNTLYTQEDTYSVREYCIAIINSPAGTFEKQDELVALAKAMLNYGAKAQEAFGVKTNDLADANINYSMGNVTAQMIEDAITAANGTQIASNLNDAAAALGGEYYTSSLIFLDKNTLRHYFTGVETSLAWDGNKSDYYYVQKTNIAAAELDNMQEFTIGGQTFYYSALDYIKAVIDNDKMTQAQRDLAKATYWYNQAANAYFDPQNIIDLGELTGSYEAQDGDILTGTLSGNKKITVDDGATVTLKDATITCLDYESNNAQFAGITPLGDATIILEGTNTVRGGERKYPGIYVPENYTLTIDGTGSLVASSRGDGCGIGGGKDINAGNIIINGGTITAYGGAGNAGIGSGWSTGTGGVSCGDITIRGGNVTAISTSGAGIGSGTKSSCGYITISGGTVTATSNNNGAGIGSGNNNSSCEDITISGGTVTATGNSGAGIGSGHSSTCEDIIISGGTVTATGGYSSPGIGSGFKSSCGYITITTGVTSVTATKGNYSPNSIGKGEGINNTCGTVTIGGVVGAITQSPYTYQPD